MDPLWLKAVLKALILPPTGLLLVAAAGIAWQRRSRRVGYVLCAAGVGVLLVISIPVVADLLTDVVDTSAPLDLARAREASAIVILGGGIRRSAPEYGGDTLGILTLERVRYGARIARLTDLPILVTGGTVLSGQPEATLMRAALENEYNVRVRWAEPRSRTTHENAVQSAELLRRDGIHRVLLVAHAFDMRRATAEFAGQGIQTIPAPTGARSDASRTVLDFLPSMAGLQRSYWASYEILANLVRIASGR